MKILLGIVIFYMVIMFLGKVSEKNDNSSYLYIFIITVLMSAYVTLMLFTIDYPEF